MAAEAASIPAQPAPLQHLRRIFVGISAPPEYVLTRWLFLRLLGFVYLFAFSSLWLQITGLIGSNGIAPLADFLSVIERSLGSSARWQVPTLFWFNTSDSFLLFICGAGTILAALVILDLFTLPALALLWVFYLSLFYAGQEFLSFQWDILLLEVGFLAIFFAPLYPLPRLRQQDAPSRVMIWLFRLVLFKLILESGVAKLASGDPTWRNLTATTYHYWTQPLPTPLAWYMNGLPFAFHQLEVLFTFFVELIVPFLIWGPRRVRMLAGTLIAGHQVFILLTGNYTFFNILTIFLCVSLLDDAFLRRFFPRYFTEHLPSTNVPLLRRMIVGALAVVIGFLNVVQVGNQILSGSIPGFANEVAAQFDPFHIVNGYGLFATMTTTRPEIIVEGSRDGQTWLPYEFKYKAGDLSRAPMWVAPYQPRLDWQMWFAALEGTPYAEGWFPNFARRLLQGSPDVLALLGKNPFPDSPPRYIRAMLYNYHFTDAATRQATGNWWQREEAGEFLRPTSLDDPP